MTADRRLESFEFEKPELEETEEIYWETEKKFAIINHAKQICYSPDHLSTPFEISRRHTIPMDAKAKLAAKAGYWKYMEKHPAHLQGGPGGKNPALSYLHNARDEALSYLNWCSLGRIESFVRVTC
jgi:hypothetical protein